MSNFEYTAEQEPNQGSGPEETEGAASPATDFVTRLTCSGALTKQWVRETPKGKPTCIPYDASAFNARMVPITGLVELASVLDNLDQHQAVIHGGVIGHEIDEVVKCIPRWLYPRSEDAPATIREASHHWVMMDVDGIQCPDGLDPVAEPERAAAHVISLLPEEFYGAAHWWQLTGSAGFKPGIRMRLAFWMDRKLATSDVKIWLSKVKGLDLSIYTANQLVYAAPPVFHDGIEDPVPRRSGLVEGEVVIPPERRLALNGSKPDEPWGRPQRGLSTYREWRATIGDHPDGQGFFEPLKSAIGSWVRANPIEDTAWLRADLEKAIREAQRDPSLHDDAYIELRVRDLDQAIAAITERERAKPSATWVKEINRDYAVVQFGGKTVVAVTTEREIKFITKFAFFDMFANKFLPTTGEDDGMRPSKGPSWWKHRQRREYISPGVVFEPSATPKERPGALNLWRGFAVEPKKGDWSLMQDHILNILARGNAEHAKYILDWMAYCVQHPEVPAQTALSFTGLPGSGKGVVWRIFGELFAPHFRHFYEQNQFTGRFNANLGRSVFVLLDEAIWGGDKTIIGKIQAMITEPTLTIEPKGIDQMEVPNRLSVVSCSNEAWSVPIGIGDRRWAAFKTDDRYSYGVCDPTERKAYFKALYSQMENGGRAAMLYDLLRRKVSADDIRDVPNTEEKARLKSLSLRPTLMWLEMILQQGEIPPYDEPPWTEEGLVIEKSLPFDSYKQFCSEHGKRPDPQHVWAKELKTVLGEAVEPEYRQRVNGKLGQRKFRFAPLPVCRERFDRHVGNTPGGAHWPPYQAAREGEYRPSHLRVVELDEPLGELTTAP